jgi:hypothetical protein
LVSSVLCKSEAWFNLTKPELDLLESVDLMLLRGIINAPKSTSKEMFFLELGISPLRDLIRQRRLNFLHYLLSQGADSMLFKVLEKQCENPTSRDWVTTVINDLEDLRIKYTFKDIQSMSKSKWKNILKIRTAENTFKNLENMKTNHSKVKNIHHKKLEIQPYLLPNTENITRNDIQWIFKIRCREVKVKMNFKGLYDTFECEMCQEEFETQEHIYVCQEIWKVSQCEERNLTEYEKVMNGNIEEQVKVAKILRENVKILDR